MSTIVDRDLEFAYQIIDESEYAVLCVFDYNLHALPFSAVREDDVLYFASGKTGLKVDIFEHEDMIKVVFVTEAHVPNRHGKEEIEEALSQGNLSFLTDHVYTNEYRSAIADGRVELVEDQQERQKALHLLYDKYYHEHMEYFETIRDQVLEGANIYKIWMTNVTAKEKKENL